MDSIEFVNWVWCVWKWGLDTPNISQVLKDRWWLTTELWEFLIFRQTHWLTSANSLHLFFPGWQIVGMGWKRHSWQHPAPSVFIVSSTFHLDHVGSKFASIGSSDALGTLGTPDEVPVLWWTRVGLVGRWAEERFHALSTRLDAANAGERDLICAWQDWSAMEPRAKMRWNHMEPSKTMMSDVCKASRTQG